MHIERNGEIIIKPSERANGTGRGFLQSTKQLKCIKLSIEVRINLPPPWQKWEEMGSGEHDGLPKLLYLHPGQFGR